MTKKDYILIAKVFRSFGPLQGEKPTWRLLAWDMADMLQLNNERFDRKKFLAACVADKW